MTHKTLDPKLCENPRDMARYLESQGLHYKRTTGGHDIYGNDHGSIPLSTHDKLDKGLRCKIIKEVAKILAFGVVLLCVLVGWGVL
jgi:predicted RNA binding protein YcfA (HicA-like mRNA interferase family)